MALITIEEAIGHLRLDLEPTGSPPAYSGAEADDLIAKIEEASAMVMDYLKKEDGDSPGWGDETAPYLVKAAVKLVLGALWVDREGAGGGDFFNPNGPVARILARYRDPAMA